MSDRALIEVHPDADALAVAVAGELLERLARLQEAGHVPQVVLTGGTIADRVHRAVAERSAGSGVDWTRVAIWFGDERFVPADSAERNAGQAAAALLDAVGATQVHAVPASDEVATAEEAADRYCEALREHGTGSFDIVMLGLGPDDHVASLFPGHPGTTAVGVSAIAVHDSPKPPPTRVSLTFEALNRGRVLWFLVSGAEKAAAVAAALAEPAPDRVAVPAAGVHGVEETTWFLDHDAASEL